jgi:hypothetical protein
VTDSNSAAETAFVPDRIVSGGQTGVDRAALDVAIALGIEHGGWCPAGRLSEDGSIPSRYQLEETPSPDYPVRTEQNVIDSDATLILYRQRLKGGTLLTRKICDRMFQPYVLIRLDRDSHQTVRKWLSDQRPRSLNVAGPRESTCQGVYQQSFEFLMTALTTTR